MRLPLRLALLPLLDLFLPFSHPCVAQNISAYGSAALTAYGLNSGNSISYKGDTGGFILGAFYNFPIQSRLTAGVDVRLNESPGAKGGTAGLASLRIAFVPHTVRPIPFFQIGGGLVSVPTPTPGLPAGTVRHSGGAAVFTFGLDLRLTDRFDLRPFELGGAASNTAGTGFLDAGVVFHLNPSRQTRHP